MSVFGLPGCYIGRGGYGHERSRGKTGGNIGAESYRRFLDGEEEGLAEIVREYQNGLIAFLQSFVWDYCEAEELAQTVFFKLWSRKPVFREECRFKTWLFTMARNAAVDWLRKKSRIADDPAEDYESNFTDELDPEQFFIQKEQQSAFVKALPKLPSDYRRVIELVYLENLSHREAGLIMGKNARQIRNLLFRAKKH
ncbi:MAG: sigma-70 family RNA polymerase sigma factor [Lachnospiraceae bacterium]|nr:sigma-70 family RNA polymerase sigma factor [Clostridia bacterium]MBQ6076267.1 sigma-70 family RNA polymerase sigma factor [Lachnospiraceae bacterium]